MEPDPTSSDQEREVSELVASIHSFLYDQGYHNTDVVFGGLVQDRFIESNIIHSQRYSERRHLNRHDKLHALRTSLIGLKIFKLLIDVPDLRGRGRYDSIVFETVVFRGLPDEYACMSVLIPCYCHDMYRYMKDHDEAVAETLACISHRILPQVQPPSLVNLDLMLPVMVGCLDRHGGNVPAVHVEEGITMLSDAAENDKRRILGDFPPAEVLSRDEHPIEYYSCRRVEEVEVVPGPLKKIEFIFHLREDAGWYRVHEFLKVLKNSGLMECVSVAAYHPEYGSSKIAIM